jgi:hypothetical protein
MKWDFPSPGGKLFTYLPKWEDRQICLLTCWAEWRLESNER